MTHKITTPFTAEVIEKLRAGDNILLSGEIYTARDAAHKRLIEEIPFDPHGQAVYYAGPCPAPPGRPIGSAGPTTSSRMDAYAPQLIAQDLKIMIGKGIRSPEVIAAIKQHGGLYLAAAGGAGALISLCVEECRQVAYEDLGTEAVHLLSIKDMPLTVAIDSKGGNIYDREDKQK